MDKKNHKMSFHRAAELVAHASLKSGLQFNKYSPSKRNLYMKKFPTGPFKGA